MFTGSCNYNVTKFIEGILGNFKGFMGDKVLLEFEEKSGLLK